MQVTHSRPRWQRWHHRRFAREARGFSLTELMVVMVILAALLVAAAPVFMKSSTKARQASREVVKGHLNRARSHAIATQQATAVLFANYNAGPEVGGKMLGIAEMKWEDDPNDAKPGAYEVKSVLQRWEKLPGSMMVMDQSSVGHQKPSIMDVDENFRVRLNRKDVDARAIIFSPSGQIVAPVDQAIEILLGAGNLTNGQVTATEKNGGKISYDRLQINRLTGRARQTLAE